MQNSELKLFLLILDAQSTIRRRIAAKYKGILLDAFIYLPKKIKVTDNQYITCIHSNETSFEYSEGEYAGQGNIIDLNENLLTEILAQLDEITKDVTKIKYGEQSFMSMIDMLSNS